MINEFIPVITIDGPSGTGKGTVAKMLATKLNWHFLDSGMIYRYLAIWVINHQIDIKDIAAIVKGASQMQLSVSKNDEPGITGVNLANQEIMSELRSEQCGNLASILAKYQEVREALLEKQRTFRRAPGLVADGRDMGTVVFKDAILKIFLTASCEIRAKRRYQQLIKMGKSASLAEIKKEILKRDERDSNRKFAPLKPAKDAVVIDTSLLNPVQVFDNILHLYLRFVDEQKL